MIVVCSLISLWCWRQRPCFAIIFRSDNQSTNVVNRHAFFYIIIKPIIPSAIGVHFLVTKRYLAARAIFARTDAVRCVFTLRGGDAGHRVLDGDVAEEGDVLRII